MSGNDKQNAHDTKEKLGAVLDDEYQGKEVVFIAFDKEKTSVTLDDNFVIIEAIEKREKLVKVAAAIFSLLCLVAIICASIFLMVSDSKNARNGQSILAEASGGGTEYASNLIRHIPPASISIHLPAFACLLFLAFH